MKFTIGNLGKVKEANLELGDLTIICGPNNMGKTYIAYAIYIFLRTISSNLFIEMKEDDINDIFNTGSCCININEYWNDYKKSLKEVLPLYAQDIARFLAISDFAKKINSIFDVFDIEEREKVFFNNEISTGYAIGEKYKIYFQKKAESYELTCTLNNEGEDFPDKEKLKERLSFYFSKIFTKNIFPSIQGMTGERSGISLFGTYLREISSDQTKQEFLKHRPVEQGETFIYPKPILDEIDFFFKLNNITKSNSMFHTEANDDLLNFFKLLKELTGGTYNYQNNIITYKPINSTKSLSLREVSSSVKALVGLYFYLKHQAQPGNILMIDEPELNLHPKNQRNMARLLAMLVNAGIKVFITTHSDYIIREFNTLIQLNNDDAYLKKLQKQEGYAASELLDASKVKAYVAEKQEDGVVLKEAPTTQKDGITIDTLDDVIDKMNQIHDAIIWGE